jgi:hypothetical protein
VIIFGRDRDVISWALEEANKIGISFDMTSPTVALGVIHDSKLICAVLYHNYIGNNIEMSIISTNKRWCTRKNLKTFFAYPFLQLNCLRVTARVAKMNKASRRLVESCGFKYEGNVRKGQANGDDCIVYGMFQNECKYLRG